MPERAREQRSFTADIEVRASERLIEGIVAPFGETTYVWSLGGEERFVPGAFARTIASRGERIPLLANHDEKVLPAGRSTEMREDARGLFGRFRISATRAGDELLTLVSDGVVTGFSVGMVVLDERWDRTGVREVTEAKLMEVSATAFPAYAGAQVTAVRSELASLRALLDPPPDPTPLDLLRRRLRVAA